MMDDIFSSHGCVNSNNPPPLSSSPSSSDNDNIAATMSSSTNNNNTTSALDEHAILETLFYNEMRMMDFFHPAQEENEDGLNAFAEHARHLSSALLNEGEPVIQSQKQQQGTEAVIAPLVTSGRALMAVPDVVPAVAPDITVPSTSNPVISTSSPVISTVTQAAPVPYKVPQQPTQPTPNPTQQPIQAQAIQPIQQTNNTAPPQPQQQSQQPPKETEQAKQLVNQFATLASRLGISLPASVLSSLTTVATIREKEHPTAPVVTPVATPDVPEQADNHPLNKDHHPKEQQQQQPNNKPTKRRKRPRIEDCHEKLTQLKQENDVLKRHLDNISKKTERFERERLEAENIMKRMMMEDEKGENNETKTNEKEEELRTILEKFAEMYSDYGRYRQEELNFHLNQLEKLAAPISSTKMFLWILNQPTQFFTKPKRNALSTILMRELKITPLQGKKILDHRQKIQQLCHNISTCLNLIKKLKKICSHKQKTFSDRMTKCQQILTPSQVCKLLLWVNEHENVLNGVCPGWGSETLRRKRGRDNDDESGDTTKGDKKSNETRKGANDDDDDDDVLKRKKRKMEDDNDEDVNDEERDHEKCGSVGTDNSHNYDDDDDATNDGDEPSLLLGGGAAES